LSLPSIQPAIAYVIATSIAARVYVYHYVKQLRAGELIGGKRIWRMVEARRVRHEIGSARRIAIMTLRRHTALQTWSTIYLSDVLYKSPRWCTWPLPVTKLSNTPPQVTAARSVS
jgi:hypothetical protein